jgi:hypothetical protein
MKMQMLSVKPHTSHAKALGLEEQGASVKRDGGLAEEIRVWLERQEPGDVKDAFGPLPTSGSIEHLRLKLRNAQSSYLLCKGKVSNVEGASPSDSVCRVYTRFCVVGTATWHYIGGTLRTWQPLNIEWGSPMAAWREASRKKRLGRVHLGPGARTGALETMSWKATQADSRGLFQSRWVGLVCQAVRHRKRLCTVPRRDFLEKFSKKCSDRVFQRRRACSAQHTRVRPGYVIGSLCGKCSLEVRLARLLDV